MKVQGIYKITNTVNNKVYIGSSKNIGRRWKSHKYSLNRGDHANIHLQHSYNKYGKDSFVISILELVDDSKDLLKVEQDLIISHKSLDYKAGYNLSAPLDVSKIFKITDLEDYKKRRKVILMNKKKAMIAVTDMDCNLLYVEESQQTCADNLNLKTAKIQLCVSGKIYGNERRRMSYKGYRFINLDKFKVGDYDFSNRRKKFFKIYDENHTYICTCEGMDAVKDKVGIAITSIYDYIKKDKIFNGYYISK